MDLNGDRPIEPHPTCKDGIYRSPDLEEVRSTACLGVMEVIDYPLAQMSCRLVAHWPIPSQGKKIGDQMLCSILRLQW